MKTLRNTLAIALLGCLPLLAACNRQPDPPKPADNGSQPTSALGGIVKKATDEARERLATENISIGDGPHISVNGFTVERSGGQPKAEITPQGDLLIENKPVAVNPAQRALLLQYRQHVFALAETGMEIGVQGADLGMHAASEAIKGIFNGNPEQMEQRIEAQAAKIEAAALKLCAQLPPLLDTQQKLATTLPEFQPYATMDQSDIDDCDNDNDNADTNRRARGQQRDAIRSEIRSSIRKSIQVVSQGTGKVENSATTSKETTDSDSATTR